ncbi:MAG: FAD-dependent oxidoreductase [Candidatus Fimivivens sp.]|nr:FAD-dependent oxidoreductase [Candidatus Fimivivens sp.]
MLDTAIIGYGPAGISAALYLRRANKTVVLIGKDAGSLQKAEKIENYFGLPTPIAGPELAAIGIEQAKTLGAEIISDEVLDLSWDGSFNITCKNSQYQAASVILATGSARKTLPIAGLADHEGRGVSYCAVCDAFFYRGKTVGVLGDGSYALHEVNSLLPVVERVLLLTNGASIPNDLPENVIAITETVVEIFGEPSVAGVKLKNGEVQELSGVFVALGSATAGDFARKIGAELKDGRIVTDSEMQTAVPGLFAAGDCIGGLMQVATAVSEGAQAAMSALKFLRERAKG